MRALDHQTEVVVVVAGRRWKTLQTVPQTRPCPGHLATTGVQHRHEIAGIVIEAGCNVLKLKIGDTVGVGCLVGACRSCEKCVQHKENYCPKLVFAYNSIDIDGKITYGGYSNIIVVDEHFVVKFPKNFPIDRGAPLLCAGITVYSPMKNFELDQPGKHIGVVVVRHLPRVASDHCPILLNLLDFNPRIKRTIKFKDVWASNSASAAVVRGVWEKNLAGSLSKILNSKMKKSLKALFYWRANHKTLFQLKECLLKEIEELQVKEANNGGLLDVDSWTLKVKVGELNSTLARLNTWWR
ncbi:uncharacterized protein LOC110116728 [Dendrobium catenatum]|uniref:uncharacterized protein LOC110116728 n=1 Tax=Dendrobium catenatum TaxID=906689 RepID=UPI0010A01885|nr:uncharacterized protein LOC110116728 [Dendrobium catenatum]